jgi:predicted HAD superfamily Cof-like phosphohydrolase
MKEPRPLNDVANFHKTFNLPILDDPTIPPAERCKLRIALIEEELNELKEAIEDNDLVEVADAFCDIQYVLSGAILEFGLGNKFKALFEEVQRSNMSKTCKTMEEAEATKAHYEKTKGAKSYIEKKGDEFLVFRKEDGKVFKSVNYSPADIKSILYRKEDEVMDL